MCSRSRTAVPRPAAEAIISLRFLSSSSAVTLFKVLRLEPRLTSDHTALTLFLPVKSGSDLDGLN